MSADTGSASARFARFARDLRIDAVPEPTRARARLHLLDTLGAALAGSAAREAHLARRAARADGSLGAAAGSAAVVWGTPERATPRAAALVNGVAAHAFELDDSGGCDHSGAVVVPAALAAAAAVGGPVPGEELLLAIVLGYELGRRVQTAMGGYDALNDRGWHSTGVCGTFAAAVAAGRVLGLDAVRLSHAIGLAGAFTGGTWAFVADSAMSKRLHVGRAAECGLGAALLAREGFTGPDAVFEAPWGGVLGLYGGPGADATALTASLGERWELDRASIKPHASCRSTHSAIDALLRLRADGLDVERIERIEVRTSELIAGMCGGTDLASLVSAQLSLPYGLAVAGVRGAVGLDDVLAGRDDPRVLDLLGRIAVAVDPGQHGGSAEPSLLVTGATGTLAVQAIAPRGGRDNRLADAEVLAKFEGLAARRLDAASIRGLIDGTGALERHPDVRALIGSLATASAPELVE